MIGMGVKDAHNEHPALLGFGLALGHVACGNLIARAARRTLASVRQREKSSHRAPSAVVRSKQQSGALLRVAVLAMRP